MGLSGDNPGSKDASGETATAPTDPGTRDPSTSPAESSGLSNSETEVEASTLDQVTNLFGGWMSAATAAASAVVDKDKASRGIASGSTETDGNGDAAAGSSIDPGAWFQDAGRMWETALKDVGERIESAKLDEKVEALRDSSTHFFDDVSKNIQTNLHQIDSEKIRSQAEAMQASTKDFIATASQQWQTRTKEAMEIFVDKPNVQRPQSYAPWDEASLPEGERKYADALREEMLKIVVDSIYSKKRRTQLFLLESDEIASFSFNYEENSGLALGVLDADQNTRRLRAGLVPQKISEEQFWTRYFFHVKRVREELVAHNGVLPVEPSVEDEDAAALFAEADDEDEELAELGQPSTGKLAESSAPTAQPRDSNSSGAAAPDDRPSGPKDKPDGAPKVARDWEDEIDALFEGGDDK